MKAHKVDTVEDELVFLKEQLNMIQQQRQIHDELESILLKMKSLAEYRKASNLLDAEIKNLNTEMQFYEAQYQFLNNFSVDLYNTSKFNVQ